MVGKPVPVGFQNFIDLFTQERFFFKTFRNTFTFMGATTVLGLSIGMAFALMINSVPKMRRFFQTVYYLPAILPFIAGTMLWESMYAKYGILNSVLNTLGKESIKFISTDNAMKSLIVMAVWGGILCITIIGIPFAKQCFKLARICALPFGATVEKD